LALNVADDQPADVCSAAAAFVLRLDIKVLDVLGGELDRYAALAFSSGPTGHGVLVGFPTIGGADAEPKGVGWQGHNLTRRFMPEKDISTTHHQHNQLVLLGDIATQMERIGDLLELLVERQGAQANALLQLSDEHGSKVAGPFR
jgi:hypothetical protein